VLTPCVLPLLPALLVVSDGRSRRGVWGLALGIVASFAVLALLLAGLLSRLGLAGSALHWLAAGALAAAGLVLLVPPLHRSFTAVASRVASRVPVGRHGSGFSSGVLSGLPLGLVWAPCAGPILAGISLAASTQRFSAGTFVLMAGYASGMIAPLALVVVGGRKLASFLRRSLRAGAIVPPIMGIVLLGTAALIATGWLNNVNQVIAEAINLTSTPTAAIERRALEPRASEAATQGSELTPERLRAFGYPENDSLEDLGPAPELSGVTGWLNTGAEPLTIAGLRGRVVLVDFWTYSCINCIRTLPYLRAWHDRYADDGLVVLGVHTPEFQFEKDPANVARAVDDFGIRYPVALDPDYRTWHNYYNRYWPAHYLIDREGRIRFVHYGEGAYEQSERYIQQLLAITAPVESEAPQENGRAHTPETYLGYRRADRYEATSAGSIRLVRDSSATYEPPMGPGGAPELPLDSWALSGEWRVEAERAVAGRGAAVYLRFGAADVHIVSGPATDMAQGTIHATGDVSADVVTVENHSLFTIRTGEYAEGILRLDVSAGLALYTFTFG
jgi:cytochrome c biogenesis protein CcdA/thiol-disulfide isomerase/thioredoxin